MHPKFDRVALAVVGRVEMRRPCAGEAKFSAVARLIGLVRDGAADPAPAQVGAVPAGGVCLVRSDPISTDAWAARPDAGHSDLLEYGFELRRVAALPGRLYI